MTEREIQRRLEALADDLHAWSQRMHADCAAAQREIERAIALLSRQMRMPSNYLGSGFLVCTGERFWRPHEQCLQHMGRDRLKLLVERAEKAAP